MTYARHYFDFANPTGPTACGGTSYGFGAVTNRFDAEHPVTCKRCLASLAKRDLAFQRKARRGLGTVYGREFPVRLEVGKRIEFPGLFDGACRRSSADAIAREEGRAL